MIYLLDTTAVVDLNFRQEKHAGAVRQEIPEGAKVGVSAYVLFELARGYLTKLRELLDLSFECRFPDELRERVEKKRMGSRRLSDTWTDVLNDDCRRVRELPVEDADKWRAQELPLFRMRLRTLILDGWDGCTYWRASAASVPEPMTVWNACGCRTDLPAPERMGERLQHDLPTALCGTAGNCGLLAWMREHGESFRAAQALLAKSKAKAKAGERERRMAAIEHLLGAKGEEFEGTQCHSCGDAIIAREACGEAVVTKDGDYKALCKATGTTMVKVPHVG